MEAQNLMEVLRATIDLNMERRKAAEYQLNQMFKTTGFGPTILQIVMQSSLELAVRQAGAVYLKHLINKCWSKHEVNPAEPIPFSLNEQDRVLIRGALMDAIVHVPELVRVQLSMCMNHILNSDFPGHWPQVVGHIGIYLQNQDANGWNGALLTMYQMVKIYESNRKDRTPMYEAMNLLLPITYQLMVRLLNEQSVQSALLQKQILKIYYSLTRYSLPLEYITKEIFSQWMEICRHVADSDVPDSSHLADDVRQEFPYWKTKKWALHIMVNMFTRYGSSQKVVSEKYQGFAEWYLPTFSQGVLQVLFKILEQYRNQVYVSPRVLTDVLYYLKRAVQQAYTWKLIKPLMQTIIQDVIFPIMSFSDSDQKLWESDPNEFIRLSYNSFEDYILPVSAAQSLLLTICKKRKSMLPKAIVIMADIISSPDADNSQKDGALNMAGTLSDVLRRKAMYCDQMESLLNAYVLPEYKNPAGHIRARACWVMNSFSNIQFKNPKVIAEIMQLNINALLTDKELPVKVQAAIGVQMFLTGQDEAEQFVVGQIKEICKELLILIRETENDDLTNVLQNIVCSFPEQLTPLATEICEHLAITFSLLLESDEEESNEKTQTAWSVLGTFDTLLSVMEYHPDILLKMQQTVTKVVNHIFLNNLTDFYEVTFELVYDLTIKAISPEMWQMLELIYQVIKKDGNDYFSNSTAALYNYVTVDTPAFLSNPNRLMAIFDMCQTILTSSPGENSEWYAAKLMEVIILQCMGQIDAVIPMFVDLAMSRLRSEVQSSDLRTMCLQVAIAALYYNPQLLLSILDNMSQQNNEPISAQFIKQWLSDTEFFLGVHDRKLCVLGLCTLISLGDAKPQVLSEVAGKIMPALIVLFNGLKRAYKLRTQEEEEEEEEESDGGSEPLDSDEDDMNEMGLEESSEDEDETDSECFITPIDVDDLDEYWTFKEVINALSAQDQAWYALLTSNLTPEQTKALQEVMVIADQHKPEKESNLITKDRYNYLLPDGPFVPQDHRNISRD